MIFHLRQQGFEVIGLPLNDCQAGNDNQHDEYRAWLGGRWDEDADSTIAAIGSEPVDWLVVDHYAIDRRWEQRLRGHCHRLMVIDDLANREHDCDLLLDQNLVADMETRYAGLLPTTCKTLLGPTYALLQPEFAKVRAQAKVRVGKIRRVLVFFGGVDNTGMTAKSIAALSALEPHGLEADIVIGASNRNIEQIRTQITAHSNMRLHVNLPTLAPLIAAADLGVGACGVNTWERLCLGLPSIVVTLAKNQLAAAQALHRKGLIRWVGDHENVCVADLASAFQEILVQDLASEWSEACFATVDGRGLERVAEAMRPALTES